MRFKQLDLLRGLAIFLVLGRHLAFFPEYKGWGSIILKLWEQAGWIGVDLFFVLSGFLVSGLLFKEYQSTGKIKITNFLIRRGFKIYPPYYFLLSLTLIISFIFFHRTFNPYVVWSQILFLQNYFFEIWGHTWSLAIEEHFYLFAGFYIFFCSQRKSLDPFRILVKAFIFIAIMCFLFRLLTYYIYPIYSHQTHLFPTHLRIDSLMFGVLLSYFHHFHQQKFNKWVLTHKNKILLVSILFISTPFLFVLEKSIFIPTIGLTCLYLGFGGIMMILLYTLPENICNKFEIISKTGKYSYSIYLWHLPVIRWMILPLIQQLSSISNLWLIHFILLYIIISVVLGICMAKLVEFPFLRYRDKILPAITSG